MNSERKNFIQNNNAFICKNCKSDVQKHKSSSRNHCTKCLYSLHIDENIPGDRKSSCLGVMEPIFIEQKHQKFVITHKCQKCGKISKNIIADDDNTNQIILLTNKSNITSSCQNVR